MMRRQFALASLTATLLVFGLARSAAAGDSKSPAQTIAPFVDELTFLVVRIDVTRIKADDIVGRIDQFLGPNAPPDKKDLPRLHARFLQAGGRDLYLLFSMAEPARAGLVVVPIGADADKKALKEFIQETPNVRVAEKSGALLIGPEKSVEDALKREPKAIPELAKAFAAVESSSAQAVVLPPRPFLRAQEELAPNLPPELGGGPITVLTRGFHWAAAGAEVGPKLQFKAVVQAADADAATALGKLADRFVQSVLETAQREAPMLTQLLPMLKPKVEGDRLVLALEDKALGSVLTPAVSQTRLAAQRAQSVNNLKQVAIAMHNYHDTYKSFPPQANLSKGKKQLLSWRVHILPYIEQDALYRAFKLDEPWDSEHNKKLIAQIPKVYQSPLARNVPAGKTVYLAPAGPGMIFGGPKGMTFSKIADGTSNTIMLVEAADAHAVTWTQPDDFKPERKDPTATLMRADIKGFHIALADGSVRMVGNGVAADAFWAMLTASGGEVVEPK